MMSNMKILTLRFQSTTLVLSMKAIIINEGVFGCISQKIGWTDVPKLTAESFASDTADDQSFLVIAQELSGPIHCTAVNQLQVLIGGIHGMDVETKVAIVASAFCSLVVEYTFHLLELRTDHGKKLVFDLIGSRV